MNDQKTILLINAHLTYPNWAEGKLNQSFFDTAKTFFEEKNYGILQTKVENGYDPDEEVEKHVDADIVILQTPVNWFGAPWIYKKYVDEVFNCELNNQKMLTGDGRTRNDVQQQYGMGGKMKGKKFMICATWNAPKAAFDNPKDPLLRGKGTEDLFLNITSNYRFCGYDILKSYNTFDIYKNSTVVQDLKNYPVHLASVLKM